MERPKISSPSQRAVPGASLPRPVSGASDPQELFPPLHSETSASSPRFEDVDGSLPLLENIWEHLDELAASANFAQEDAAPTAPDAAPATPALQEPANEPLLKRSPQSALEHLKKVSTVRRVGSLSGRPLPSEARSSPTRVTAGGELAATPGDRVPSPPTQWLRILMATFAIAGLAGGGLLAYQYYTAVQAQRQQEAAALQQREQEEAMRLVQEAAQKRTGEAAGYIDQARKAIAAKNWNLATLYLDRATALAADDPALAAARAELAAATQPAAALKTWTENRTGLVLHGVKGGCFTMGSPATERDRGRDEAAHPVCVKDFWMSATEITNGQFRRFKPAHDSGSFQGRSLNDDAQPVVNLNWDEARAFAEWLSWEADSGQRFRLPTEAEWEYAARAGATTRYFWGNDIDPRYANFSDRNDPTGASIGNLDDGYAVTAPVGSYQPNRLGLRDMAGNVWEWTCSDYNPNYGGDEQRCSTLRPSEGQRVVRGGSWNNGAGELRLAERLARKPDHRDAMTGFRVLMEEAGATP